MPKVSVVMSVYNGERYVGEAVESVLNQTFRDFELIVIDDGSTDRTGEILHGFQDNRIVHLSNGKNIGLTKSLNKGLRLAKGEFVARLDADDVALPERLEKQVRFLDTHPDVGLVGCAVIYIAPDGRELGMQRIRARDFYAALLNLEFCWEHSSVMFRTACARAVGLYREAFRYAQDYDLWLRIAEKSEVMVLRDPLVKLRLHPASISTEKRIYQRAYVMLALALAGQRWLTGRDNPYGTPGIGRGSEPGALPKIAPGEVGRAYLRVACVNYLLGDIPRAKSSLVEAVRCDPTFLQDIDWILQRVVYYGIEHAVTPTSKAEAVSFVRRVFANLPPPAEVLVRSKSKALGKLHAVFAFEDYERGDYPSACREILLAVVHDPSWLKNRGVWSIFVRSLGARRFASNAASPTMA